MIRPLSGYINRLQAIISAQLLADDLEADLWVDWRPSEVTPVPIDGVLDPHFCEHFSKSTAEIITATGVDPAAIPRYFHADDDSGIITLAGVDRGEQVFMPSLKRAWNTGTYSTLVISAGGKFTLDGSKTLTREQQREFRARRHQAYSELRLHPGVEEAAESELAKRGPFLALHLRYSDRSVESPWSRRIAPAVKQLSKSTGVKSLFVAADTQRARQEWMHRALALDLHPWSTAPVDAPRSDPRSAWGALVDWRLLTRSAGMVYFAASSFAEEAAVASGAFDVGIGLRSGPLRKAFMRCREYTHAALTYRERHSRGSA